MRKGGLIVPMVAMVVAPSCGMRDALYGPGRGSVDAGAGPRAPDARARADAGATATDAWSGPAADAAVPTADASSIPAVGSCGDAPSLPTSGVCRAGGGVTWCWDNPQPAGETYLALGGAGADDLWTLTNTMVLHRAGGRWIDTMDGNFERGAFYAPAADDVWLAAGYQPYAGAAGPTYTPPGVWHWDGRAWTLLHDFNPRLTGDLAMTGIWGSGPSDIWVTAEGLYGGVLAHYDGSAWTEVAVDGAADGVIRGAGPSYFGVWGSAGDDVWTVAGAQLFHFDGQTWRPGQFKPDDKFFATLSGAGPDDLWVGGHNSVARFDGAAWTTIPLGNGDSGHLQFLSPVVLGPRDVWVLAALAPDGGNACTAVHWDGSGWTSAAVAPVGIECFQTAVGWAHGGLVAAGYNGRIEALTCDRGLASLAANTTTATLEAVWGAARNDLWAVGDKGTILHGTAPGQWRSFPSPTTAHLYALWGARADSIWAVGAGGAAIHWDGNAWSAQPIATSADVVAIAGSGVNDVWAVTAGEILRFDGRAWSVMRAVPTERYGDVAAIAPDDVWITGEGGFVHWTGSAFSVLPAPASDAPPAGIRAFARDDVWADSAMRWVFHYDGTAWTTVAKGGVYQNGQTAGYGPFIGKIAGDDPHAGPFFLMRGEIGADGNLARVGQDGTFHPLPKPYVGTDHYGAFVLQHEAWLVGDYGAIEHAYLPYE